MERFTRGDLEQIAQQSGRTVSIYIPTARRAPDSRQNPTRAMNSIKIAEERLIETGLRRPEAEELLAPVRRRCDDHAFWTQQADGLAIFSGKNFFRYYRLPCNVREQVVVGPRFYVKPLIALVQDNGRYYVLAMSKRRAKVYAGNKSGLSELSAEGLPNPLVEALRTEEYLHRLRSGELRFSARGTVPAAGNNHEQRPTRETLEMSERDDLISYFYRLSDALGQFLRREPAPLVFAGLEHLFPILKATLHYRQLFETPLVGNPETWNDAELHTRTWKIIRPHFRHELNGALDRYGELADRRRAADDLAGILRAAQEGRVDTLLIAEDRSFWGRFDDGQPIALPPDAPRAEELVNRLVIESLAQGAKVFSVPGDRLPAGEFAAALLRFSSPAPVEAIGIRD